MCYRYSIHSDTMVIESRFDATFQDKFEKKYHTGAFDQTKLPVITNELPKQIQLYNWGLVPFWIKTSNQADEIKQRTVNARAETIYEKPAYRNSAENKHCLVIADGFFEWRYFQGRNYPYYIRLKSHEPFAIAGLWDCWKNNETNEKLYSYTIITCPANPLMAKIHNKKKRMPVILTKEMERYWINNSLTKDQAEKILIPFEQDKMEAYTISRLITSKNQNPNVPEVINQYKYPELKESNYPQKSLF
ncbi:MAG: SOS response-associated peptidase [Thermoplasmatales archaeon]|nr:MAG: SOS response-associated peptidase [Thermoplasmatales archaeon]